jgi:hypothetical protein
LRSAMRHPVGRMRSGKLERLAAERGLGALEESHSPRLAPLVGLCLGVPLALAGTALWAHFVAPGDSGPGRVLWPLVGVTVAGVCAVLAVASALDGSRRIATCELGLLHRRRGRVEAVRWDAVAHVRRRWWTTYEVEARSGTRIVWNEELHGHDELFRAAERRVTPLLLAAARARLAGGGHVAFDSLVVTTAGLTAHRAPAVLPWSQVAAVKFGAMGEARIRRRGHGGTWFAGMVPDQAVLRALVDELLHRSSQLGEATPHPAVPRSPKGDGGGPPPQWGGRSEI